MADSSHRTRIRIPVWLRRGLVSLLLTVVMLPAVHAAPPVNPQLGLPEAPMRSPSEAMAHRVALGQKLFFDARLSRDGTISCASCHIPEKAFSDGLPLAKGVGGAVGTRNTPSLLNVAYGSSQFWDGRRGTLEDQAADPLLNPFEQGNPGPEHVLSIIRSDPEYLALITQAFAIPANGLTLQHVVSAFAAYERTLVSGASAFDRHFYGREADAMSAAAIRGFALFRGRAQCASCHVISEQFALFTDNQFHSLGIGVRAMEDRLAAVATLAANAPPRDLDRLIISDVDVAALGRFAVTKQPRDIGRFRTPSLRNVALTAPYMHDGSVPTLEEAIDVEIYYRGIESNRSLILTPTEKADLAAFLRALTSSDLDKTQR